MAVFLRPSDDVDPINARRIADKISDVNPGRDEVSGPK